MTEQENKNVFKRIMDNYSFMNKMMIQEMEIASKHGGLTGNYREEMWMNFFKSIIPKKYSLAQGVMIIDSEGQVSKEVDIAVFDEQYTPYVFQYNTLKFIPIEAVAIVIECKSNSMPIEELKDWVDSIDELIPKRSGITRMVNGYVSGLTNQSQVKTRPIRILATLRSNVGEQSLEKLVKHFDIILTERESKRFEVKIPYENRSLAWWGHELNGVEGLEDKLKLQFFSERKIDDFKDDNERLEYEKGLESKKRLAKVTPELKFDENLYLTNTLSDLKVDNNPLLSLNFQLNQLLMLINNPMLFPHFAYARKFREISREEEEGKNAK
ncbi:DUF6602 domain-containing protein [Rubeoparvulum massiliense]|uniref:DUF6602 domain-containing protein n=1 Tax=Rubeoparvulum massiliense TaxID=1631346 RepID=UPI00065E8D30|nr:DUF6602 domain-containing protein [Rubeoparvulum massiliense]